MKHSEKIIEFSDRIQLLSHRLATSHHLEQIRKEQNDDHKDNLRNDMDENFDTDIN